MVKGCDTFTVETIRPNFLIVYKAGDLFARVADQVQACKAISKHLGLFPPVTVEMFKRVNIPFSQCGNDGQKVIKVWVALKVDV